MAKRDASCPLCGAKMGAAQVLDACEETIDAGRGVLSCHCPYCQGYLELRPVDGQVDIGYLRNGRFDVVLTLPALGLEFERADDGEMLRLKMPGRCWTFRA
jgi:hypothetical protein